MTDQQQPLEDDEPAEPTEPEVNEGVAADPEVEQDVTPTPEEDAD